MPTPEISIIAPTFNEAGNIARLVEGIDKAFTNACKPLPEIIIVDDNSPDGTAATAEHVAEHRNTPMQVICRTTERGLATAVIKGWEIAKADIVAVIDADLQHPPELMVKLLDAINAGADLAVATRYTEGGGTGDWNLPRKIISRTATWLAHVAIPSIRNVIHDPMSGCFALRKPLLNGVELNPTGYKILLEVAARCPVKKVVEVPYTFALRTEGQSKFGSKQMWEYLVHLWRLKNVKKA